LTSIERELESKEILEVQARLAERFRQLAPDTIADAVRRAYSELTGGIRDFVPVLVEHNARDRLTAIADRDQAVPPGTGAAGERPTTNVGQE
jgi:hypothetical protein